MIEQLRITETPNPLSLQIDQATTTMFIETFQQVDHQIFTGYRDYTKITDSVFISKLSAVISKLSDQIHDGKRWKVVLSGCGTSGRIAGYIAIEFNHLFANPNLSFDYLCAGGPEALLKEQEGAEDDPIQAVKDLQSCEKECDRIIYIGITCGLSAGYIAGQMDYIMNHPDHFGILIGFNPLEMGRNMEIEGWGKSFADVLKTFEQAKNCAVLNPIVGPEGITGSTRMKGGSVTKMLCEILLLLTLDPKTDIPESIHNMLDHYQQIYDKVYDKKALLAPWIDLAAETLRNEGHIYYLAEDSMAMIAVTDGSECPPTYGAGFDEVRPFIFKGWQGLTRSDMDLSNIDWMYRIDTREFENELMPELKPEDLVFIIEDSQKQSTTFAAIKKKLKTQPCSVELINTQSFIQEGTSDPYAFIFRDLGLKIILNLITTGGYVQKGKVYQNRMIDLEISNNKLFFRAISIMHELFDIPLEKAKSTILDVLFHHETEKPDYDTLEVRTVIDQAIGKKQVIPCATLIAKYGWSYHEAMDKLHACPIMRNLLSSG